MTTATNNTPACTKPVRRGFKDLCCLSCGETAISIDADDMLIRCRECDSEFTPAEIQERLDQWSKFLTWLDMAPVVEE